MIKMMKQVVAEFIDDDCPRLAAALAYYTIFSLPAILILIISIVGTLFDPQDVQGEVASQIESFVGADGAEQIRTMIDHADNPGKGTLATILGFGMLLFGASGVLVQLQAALNTIWEVAPSEESGGVRGFIVKRLMSLAMIMGIACLLIISLTVDTALAIVSDRMSRWMSETWLELLMYPVHFAITIGVLCLLFAGIFKVLPDAKIRWKHVWVGAAATASLFAVGKMGIGLYLGNSSVASAYGAAGSLALVLVWVYYSSMLLLFGAEFTQVWTNRHGGNISPEDNAVRKPKQRSMPAF